jgi:hypothetical protein
MIKVKLIQCWKTMMITITVSLFSLSLFAQNLTLRGKVVDEKGETLLGATVKIPGTTTGATTNNSGEFTLASTCRYNQGCYFFCRLS